MMALALEASLPPPRLARLHQVRRLALAAGLPTYLAGGLVRDLLLGRPSSDLDFVVVPATAGDTAPAQRLTTALAHAHGGEVTLHRAFGTATWLDPDGAALDFTTARTETYAHPGALPSVAATDAIEADLRRRDFRVFADGQPEHRDRPDEEDHDGKHAGEDRAADEEVGKVPGPYVLW